MGAQRSGFPLQALQGTQRSVRRFASFRPEPEHFAQCSEYSTSTTPAGRLDK